jgi:hypothetical protein
MLRIFLIRAQKTSQTPGTLSAIPSAPFDLDIAAREDMAGGKRTAYLL